MTKIIFAALTALFLLGCGGGNDADTKIAYNKELGKTKDFKEKLDAGLKYCDKGLPKACEDAMEILLNGPATLKDSAKALKIAQKACDKGSEQSCIVIAVALMTPNDQKNAEILEVMTQAGLDYDIEKAISYLKKGCEYGKGSCETLINIYSGKARNLDESIREAFINTDEAAKYIEKYYTFKEGGCKDQCNKDLGDLYLKTAKDVKKAKDYAIKACDAKASRCSDLANEFEKLGDSDTAKILATSGCNRGDGYSCRLYEQNYKE